MSDETVCRGCGEDVEDLAVVDPPLCENCAVDSIGDDDLYDDDEDDD